MPTKTRIAALAITLGLVTAPLVGCGGSGSASQGGQAASATEASATSSASGSFAPSTTSSSSATLAGLNAKDAFEPNSELKHGPFTVTIPDYYGQPKVTGDSSFYAYNADNGAVINIVFMAAEQASDTNPKDLAEAGIAALKESSEGMDVTIGKQTDVVINGMKANNIAGILSNDQGKGLFLYATGIVSNDGKGMVLLTMCQGNKDGFDYSGDFAKVCNSVRYDESQAGSSSTSQAQPQEAKPEQSSESDGISPEFKASMDSYEAFFDEYVDFMRRYKEDPTNMELLGELGDMLSREADMIREFDKIEDQDLSSAEMAYYLEVHARIYKKLAEVL